MRDISISHRMVILMIVLKYTCQQMIVLAALSCIDWSSSVLWDAV